MAAASGSHEPSLTAGQDNNGDTKDTLGEKDVDDAENVIQYLILGGCLAGSVIVFMILWSAVSFCKRRKDGGSTLQNAKGGKDQQTVLAMAELELSMHDKYNDTALQISQQHLTSQHHLQQQSAGSTSQFLNNSQDPLGHGASISMIPMESLVGNVIQPANHEEHVQNNNKNYSISDNSMFSNSFREDRRNSASAELTSLGNEEYSDEPSRLSWRRRRKSEESFI